MLVNIQTQEISLEEAIRREAISLGFDELTYFATLEAQGYLPAYETLYRYQSEIDDNIASEDNATEDYLSDHIVF